MVSFREALDLLLSAVPPMGIERCRLEHAGGRVLRAEVRADRPFPPYDRVMMDGFALRSADLLTIRGFHVAGSAPAGRPRVELPARAAACVEVMTGAPLPGGADCIVPVEETERRGSNEIVVSDAHAFVAGQYIHAAGADAAAGEVLLEAGRLLGAREIGVAASCGAAWLDVTCMPQIAVIATGDELVPVDEIPADHQIRQSNAHAIAAALLRAGYPVRHLGALSDETRALEEGLRARLQECDWIILTGAVSKGSRDFIPAILDSLGCRCVFHGVSQRPGKPAGCWSGPAGQVIVGLPGNPVSALTGLHALVVPALAASSGLPQPQPRLVIPAGRLDALPGMTWHLPVSLGSDGRARATPTGNSGDFIGLLKSDGFVTLPPRGAVSTALPYTPWL